MVRTAVWLADSERAIPSSEDWLTDLERERAARMRFAKRRYDYLLGRWTAKQAVARALGRPLDVRALSRIEIRNAKDGAPGAWVDGDPAPFGISMTDRAGWAVCATLPAGVEVGCDLEVVEPRTAGFVRDWFTGPERQFVGAAPDAEHDLLANLIWCAKESALKVLHTGLRRDTRSVEVSLPGGESGDVSGGGTGDWRPLAVRATEGGLFPGWWRRFGVFLLTVVAREPTEPPVSLVEPSPLEAAEPSHAWMSEL